MENGAEKPTKTDYSRPRPVRLGELETVVDQYIEKAGIRFTDLVKKALNQFLSGRDPEKELDFTEFKIELNNLRVDLSRVGGNLNQIAHHLNIHGTLDSPDELKATHQKLKDIFREITEKLNTIQDEIKRVAI